MKRKPKKQTMTETIRATIRESELPLLRLSKETGVARASLIRFMRDEQSIRLDVADKLAEYFNLQLISGKDAK